MIIKVSFILIVCTNLLFGLDNRVILQGFYWESVRLEKPWWEVVKENISEIKRGGFDIIWLPPSQDSLSDEGYLPRKLYVQNSKYGSSDSLKNLVSTLHSHNIMVISDIVLNHRVGVNDWADFKEPDWGFDACTKDDEYDRCIGNYDTGRSYEAARDIDHTKEYVRTSVKQWLSWLRNNIGYDGFRYDYARGFAAKYLKEYNNASKPSFSVSEIWDDLDINNPDVHRQALCDWMDESGGKIKVFDFTTKGILQYAISTSQYWRLVDKDKRPSGLIGWWPSNAVTFIENHDTQIRKYDPLHRSWPFPSDRVLEGYAYILTHPGIPMVFWLHFFDSKIKEDIIKMISIRKKYKINSTSSVDIIEATDDLYVAKIDDKILVKLGNKDYQSDPSYKLLISAKTYSIWGK